MSQRRSSGEASFPDSIPKRQRASLDSENDPGVAGVVTKVVLKNFMCHQHLKVSLHDKINFICGKNGSGKSAILTAIVIGLGGRSSDTNRGALKNLILAGKPSATVEITLSNVGFKAFKPELYGDEITVLRVITESTGNKITSSFKMLNYFGKVVSTVKRELDNMLVSFGIKINNPICILNQDMARSFLKNATCTDLYKFFSWSTGINDIEKTMDYNKSLLNQLEGQLEEKVKELEYSSRDFLEMKQKYDRKERLVKLIDQAKLMRNELNWAEVSEMQSELVKKQQTLEEIKKTVANLQSKVGNKSNLGAKVLEKKSNLEKELEETTKNYEDTLEEYTQLDCKLKDKKDELRDSLSNKSKLEQQLNADKENLKKVMSELENSLSKNSENAAKRIAIAKEKEGLQQKVKDLANVITVNDTHRRNLVEDSNKKSQVAKAKEEEYRQICNKKNELTRLLGNLKKNESELHIYGDWMPALVNKINIAAARGAFSVKPIGPIGQYVKLCDEKFGPVIEKFIGANMLRGFCCNTIKDADALHRIFAEMNLKQSPIVIASKFIHQVHDVKKYEVKHHHFKSLFASLDITNPIVANCLIDQMEIECVLLVETDDEAFSLMEVKENVPRSCKSVLTPENLFYPAPNYRSYSMDVSATTYFLTSDKQQLISDTTGQLEAIKSLESKRRMEMESTMQEKAAANGRIAEADKEILRIKKELRITDDKLFRMNLQDEPMDVNEIVLTEDIEFRKDKIAKFTVELQAVIEKVKTLKKEIEEADRSRKNLKSLTDSYNSEISRLKKEISEVMSEFREMNRNFEKYEKKCEDERGKVCILEKMIEKLSNDFENKELAARDYGQKMDELRPASDLKDDLDEIESEMKEIQDLLGDGDLEEITEEYINRLTSLTSVRKLLDLTKTSVQTWSNHCSLLNKNFISVRDNITFNVKQRLQVLLKMRNYKGYLQVDHNSRKMELTVQMSSGGEKAKKQAVVCMSGGERSYSMVALLLALWEEMDVPFYFLDEFDVFMDPVNRNMVINLLVAHARNRPDRQFGFLTPNDFKTKLDNDIGIFRLDDPRKEVDSS